MTSYPRTQALMQRGCNFLGTEYAILCGMAIGYPDPTFPANNLRTDRNPIEHNVVFHDA